MHSYGKEKPTTNRLLLELACDHSFLRKPSRESTSCQRYTALALSRTETSSSVYALFLFVISFKFIPLGCSAGMWKTLLKLTLCMMRLRKRGVHQRNCDKQQRTYCGPGSVPVCTMFSYFRPVQVPAAWYRGRGELIKLLGYARLQNKFGQNDRLRATTYLVRHRK